MTGSHIVRRITLLVAVGAIAGLIVSRIPDQVAAPEALGLTRQIPRQVSVPEPRASPDTLRTCSAAAQSSTAGLPAAAMPTDSVAVINTALPGALPLPRLEVVDSAIVLRLLGPMQAALDACQPTFRPWRLNDYEPWVLSSQPGLSHGAPPTRSLPAAVVGDFNGDGQLDVAADGRTATHTTLLVILSDHDRYDVIEMSKGPLPKDGRMPGNMGAPSGRSETYLTLWPPGDIKPGIGLPIHLQTDAFAIWYEEKGTSLCYYQNGHMVCGGIGD